MKKIILIILLTGFAIICKAQYLRNQARITKNPVDLAEYDISGGAIKNTDAGDEIYKSAPAGAKFTIYDETTDGDYIVYFWDWTPINTTPKSSKADYVTKDYHNQLNYDNTAHQQRYFLIKKIDIDRLSTPIYHIASPTVGILTFPFKYRPQDGAFDQTFSLSATGGVKLNPWQTGEHTFSILVGCGSSSVNLNQFNTDAKSGITSDTQRPAITGSLSLLYQWENLQVGMSLGKDAIFTNKMDYWKDQGKTWLSFGIGLSLFTSSTITTPGSN